MTYYGAKHLADSFRTVRKNTLAIAEEIPEDKYSFKATADVMSVGEMLAHLAVSPMWQIDVHSRKMEHLDFAFFGARMQQGKAEEQLLGMQKRWPDCKLYPTFLERIVFLRANPPGSDWDGSFTFQTK